MGLSIFLYTSRQNDPEIHPPSGDFMFQGAQLCRNAHQAGITRFNSDFLANYDILSASPLVDFSHLIMIRGFRTQTQQLCA